MLIYDDALHEGWCRGPDLSIGHGPDKNMSVNAAKIVLIKATLCLHRRNQKCSFNVLLKSTIEAKYGFMRCGMRESSVVDS